MKKLSKQDKQLIIDLYSSNRKREEIERELSELFDCSERTIRNYANELSLTKQPKSYNRIMVYDIETSRIKANLWWTGKQYVNYQQLESEPKIISISWKFVGEDKVHSLHWDKNHCDKAMIKEFLTYYNNCDMVIGQNNNYFDNKWINTRAAKHKLTVNRYVKSFDIYRMAKRYFRLPSYSMDYMSNFFGLTPKQKHEGIVMWEMIENGTKEQQKEYLKKMIDYNIGDIITTEELFLTLRPYFNSVMNEAVRQGKPKWCCSTCGSKEVKLDKTIFTEMGTIQRILKCKDNHQYKVSNKTYQDFLQRAIYGN